ncbi:MAG: fluoride efflux transporter CrcB [Parahaliea sp.]
MAVKYLVYIALGGAGGAVSRYLVSSWVQRVWELSWPLGTLLVNALGSFIIGLLFVLIERQLIHSDWRAVLMVGFLGAFTTFSTFSLETINLVEAGNYAAALAYVAASATLCVAVAGAGVWLMRALTT